MELIQEAVQRGVAWMDRNVPEWHTQIDLDTLDMSSMCHCVLGQTIGFFAVVHVPGRGHSWAGRNGFALPYALSGLGPYRSKARMRLYWSELRRAWVHEIERKREHANV